MKIKYNARNVGAAALGCAMIAGTVFTGGTYGADAGNQLIVK